MLRQKCRHFVPEYGAAARLEHDHRCSGFDMRSQSRQHSLQVALGLIEHAVVVEWAAAAQAAFRNHDLKSQVLQYIYRRDGGVWKEVVVERVGPKQDLLRKLVSGLALGEPAAEGLRGESGNFSL